MSAAPAATRTIDVNADVGEGFGRWTLGDDQGLLAVVSSANVACGFHAGDPLSLRRVCATAAARGVRVGAQVSFRDLAGFGRRRIECTPEELAADVLYQLGAVHAFCVAAGTRVGYVKPHGALYHELAQDADRAAAVVAAIASFDRGLAVLGLPGSALLDAAGQAGLPAIAEGFPDRGYQDSGGLVPRDQPDALITEPARIAERAVRMATSGEVESVSGATLSVAVQSLCVHGDSATAVAAARAVVESVTAAGCAVRPFA